jgi:hypothetical protein
MHHFVRPAETYTRNVNIQKTYVQDAAKYLAKMRQIPLAKATEFVQKLVAEGGKHQFRDPATMVLVRQPNGDREQQTMRFSEFLSSVYEKRQMLSPSMTAYVHPDEKKSLLAVYIDKNLARRKAAKAEMFAAKMAGDEALANIGNSKQTTFKIKNNSLSGAHSSPYTILWNKSSHSTLTSTCRVATSYGNTNNEKFLYGNRHYWCPDVARNNIISIINHTDLVKMQAVMEKFDLQPPTMGELKDLLFRCCNEYWRDEAEMADLVKLLESLTEVERSAFAFVSDLYHLRQTNPKFVREFLRRLSHHPAEPQTVEEAKGWIKKMDGNLEAFVFMLCSRELNGGTLKDANGDKSMVPLEVARPDDFGRIGAAAKSVIDTLDYYEEFIRAFWVTDNLPASIFHAPGILRRSAVTSDTDSTIFTVQDWTIWYRGKLDFTKESEDIASATVYLAGQTIRHILAATSGAMGVAKQYVNKLSMKNEYYFPVFALTSRAKHYYAYRAAQEGNVLKELELEIKGVALRNSNIPPEITDKAHALIRHVMDSVMAGKKLNASRILRYIAKVEQDISDGVLGGKFDLLGKMQIKGRDAYKNPESSNFLHYDLWESVFAPTYGHAPPPPYVAIKVPVNLDRKQDVKAWLDKMENPAIRDNMKAWMEANGKTTMGVMMLPEQVLAVTGIPKEVVNAVDIRPLIVQTVEAFYLILESLGIFMKNKDQTRLVSDEEWLLAEDWPYPELELQ